VTKKTTQDFVHGFARCHAIWWMYQKIEKCLLIFHCFFLDCQKKIQWLHFSPIEAFLVLINNRDSAFQTFPTQIVENG